MREEGTGQRACKKLMASKLSKATLAKEGKSVPEMICALVCQVGRQRHAEKRWAGGADVLSDGAPEDTDVCSGLQSLLRIDSTPATFCIFSLSFFS